MVNIRPIILNTFDGMLEQQFGTTTSTYEGTLDYDTLLTDVMNAHGPRLAAGKHQAEYWAYTEAKMRCKIGVRCGWQNEAEKIGMLSFSMMPLSAQIHDEIVWIADVNLHSVVPESENAGDALLIVSYRLGGVYPIVFPYYYEEGGTIAYEEPIMAGAHIPAGFVDVALRMMFGKEKEAEHQATDPEGKYLAAALATSYGHHVEFCEE